MPRFFFDVVSDEASSDPDGTELPDIESARREAVAFAGAIIKDGADRFGQESTWRFFVRDETGAQLFGFSFTAVVL